MNFPTFESKTVLTAAQILTLNSIPITLVAGRTGCVIDIQSIYFRYLHGNIPFNPANEDEIFICSGNTSSLNTCVTSVVFAKNFVDQSVDMACWSSSNWAENGANPSVLLSGIIGAGISILQSSGLHTFPMGANWTLGNGQLAVFLKYSYIEV